MSLLNSLINTQNVKVLALIVLWTLPWKAVALWKSANRKEKWWFAAIFLVNTFAILEILYLFVFIKWIDKKKDKQEERFQLTELRILICMR